MAPRPSFTLGTVIGTAISMNTFGNIDGTSGGSITIDFTSFLVGSQTFHRGLTYSITSGSLPSGGSLNSITGVLTLTAVPSSNGSFTITVLNGWEKSTSISLTFNIVTPFNPPILSTTSTSYSFIAYPNWNNIVQISQNAVNTGNVSWSILSGPGSMTNQTNTGATLSIPAGTQTSANYQVRATNEGGWNPYTIDANQTQGAYYSAGTYNGPGGSGPFYFMVTFY